MVNVVMYGLNMDLEICGMDEWEFRLHCMSRVKQWEIVVRLMHDMLVSMKTVKELNLHGYNRNVQYF